MNKLDVLKEVVEESREIRLVEEGIYSALAASPHTYQYDKKAAAYDFVVGNRFYNRVMWGGPPQSYRDFAYQSIRSHPLFGAPPNNVRLRHVATRHFPSGLVQSEYYIEEALGQDEDLLPLWHPAG